MANIRSADSSIRSASSTADGLNRLKTHARVLHRAAQAKQPEAFARLRFSPDTGGELQVLSDEVLATRIKRRHCLTVVANEFGFDHWLHATQVLSGAKVVDYGKLLYPKRCHGRTNIWSASYTEAQSIRAQNTGYLLAYQRQFFIVDQHYIAALGLDPSDPDWELLNRNWINPRDPRARRRLYDKVVASAIKHFVERGPLFGPRLRELPNR